MKSIDDVKNVIKKGLHLYAQQKTQDLSNEQIARQDPKHNIRHPARKQRIGDSIHIGYDVVKCTRQGISTLPQVRKGIKDTEKHITHVYSRSLKITFDNEPLEVGSVEAVGFGLKHNPKLKKINLNLKHKIIHEQELTSLRLGALLKRKSDIQLSLAAWEVNQLAKKFPKTNRFKTGLALTISRCDLKNKRELWYDLGEKKNILTVFDINNSQLDKDQLAILRTILKNNPRLEVLGLSAIKTNAKGKEARQSFLQLAHSISEHPKLARLDISGKIMSQPVLAEFLEIITKNEKITHLNLRDNVMNSNQGSTINSDWLVDTLENSKITHINLSMCQLSLSTLERLLKIENLKYINLRCAKIDTTSYKAGSANFENLKVEQLVLDGCKLSEVMLKDILKGLIKNKDLKVLNLARNSEINQCRTELVNLITSVGNKINELNLNNCGLMESFSKKVTHILASNKPAPQDVKQLNELSAIDWLTGALKREEIRIVNLEAANNSLRLQEMEELIKICTKDGNTTIKTINLCDNIATKKDKENLSTLVQAHNSEERVQKELGKRRILDVSLGFGKYQKTFWIK